MKKIFSLSLFTIFCIANGILKRNVAGELSSITCMILYTGILQFLISILMTKEYKFYNLKILFLVFCSYTCHIILWICNSKLKSITVSLLEPSRIIFAVILSFFIIKKRYTILQNISILLIFIGISFSTIFKESNDTKIDQFFFIFLCIFGAFLNGLTSVSFLKFFPKNSINYWTYIFTFSFNSLILYISGFIYEFKTKKINFEEYKKLKILILPFTTCFEYLGYRYIGFFICPVQKNLILIIIQATIPIFYNLFFKNEINFLVLVSTFFVYFGTFLFEYQNFVRR